MSTRKDPQRKQNFTVVLTVVVVCGALAYLARLPGVPDSEAARLASQFQFTWSTLPAPPVPPGGVVFPVNKTAHAHGLLLLPGRRIRRAWAISTATACPTIYASPMCKPSRRCVRPVLRAPAIAIRRLRSSLEPSSIA